MAPTQNHSYLISCPTEIRWLFLIFVRQHHLLDAYEVIYSSIIKGFAQGKQAEKCFRTLEEMEAHGCLTNRPGGESTSPRFGRDVWSGSVSEMWIIKCAETGKGSSFFVAQVLRNHEKKLFCSRFTVASWYVSCQRRITISRPKNMEVVDLLPL